MRVRFLAAADPTFVANAAISAEKTVLPIKEEGITDEQATKREFADEELTCYISLSMFTQLPIRYMIYLLGMQVLGERKKWVLGYQ